MYPTLWSVLLHSYGSHFDQARLLLVNLITVWESFTSSCVLTAGVSKHCSTKKATIGFNIKFRRIFLLVIDCFVKSINHLPQTKKTRILSVLYHQQLKNRNTVINKKQTNKQKPWKAAAITCAFREHFMKIAASPVSAQFLLVFSTSNSLQYKEKLLNFKLLRLSYWLLFDRCS